MSDISGQHPKPRLACKPLFANRVSSCLLLACHDFSHIMPRSYAKTTPLHDHCYLNPDAHPLKGAEVKGGSEIGAAYFMREWFRGWGPPLQPPLPSLSLSICLSVRVYVGSPRRGAERRVGHWSSWAKQGILESAEVEREVWADPGHLRGRGLGLESALPQ